MPMRDIRTNIVLEGEQQYKSQLNDAMNAVKLLGLQVKENTTVYKLNSDSANGNRERMALLSKEMEQQQKIIDLYTEKIERNRQAGEGNSKETQRLEENLIKARTALAAMNNEYQQANDNIPSLKDKIKELTGHIGEGLVKAAEVAGKAVVASFSAISSACVAAGKAIYDLTGQAGTYADTILTMSDVTGIATQELMKWEYASQFIDTSVDTITGSLTKLEKNMASSSADTAAAFETLGVKITDSTGQMRDDEQVFWEIIDALGKVENSTERDQLAMTLLGKSAKDLNPLINAGSQAFKDLGEEAAATGLIMSDDSLKAFGAYDDAVNVMKSTLTAAGRSVAEVFLPATKGVIEGVTEVVQAFIDMVQGADGASEKFQKTINNLIDKVTGMFNDWLPKILETGINILISLTDGIIKAIPKLSAALPKVLNTLLTFIIENLPKIIDAGISLLSALCEGIISAIPSLVANLPAIITAIVQGLARGVAAMANVGVELVKGLWEGLKGAVGWLKDKIVGWVGDVLDFIKGLFGIHSPSTVMRDQVGKMLAEGVAVGLENEKGTVQRAFNDMLPDTDVNFSIKGVTSAARTALSAPASVPYYSGTAISYDLSDSALQKLSNNLVGALQRAGVGEAVIQLNGREFGRTMRRGLEVGFV